MALGSSIAGVEAALPMSASMRRSGSRPPGIYDLSFRLVDVLGKPPSQVMELQIAVEPNYGAALTEI
jgi:hypothetical protein